MYEQLLPAWKEFVATKVNSKEDGDGIIFAPRVTHVHELLDGTWSVPMTNWGKAIKGICGQDALVQFDGKDCIVCGVMRFKFSLT